MDGPRELRPPRYIARPSVTLVGYRVDEELARESNVTFRPVPKPLNAYTLAAPLLGASGIIEYFGKRHDPTKVIVNGGCCPVPGTNWVHYVHAAYTPEIRTSAARRARALYNHWTSLASERAALRAARRVIVNSKRTYRDVVEKVGVHEERVRTVYYGIDPTSFRPHDEDARATAREELGWSPDRPHAVFVGALNDRRKGFDVLFDAWRMLNAGKRWGGARRHGVEAARVVETARQTTGSSETCCSWASTRRTSHPGSLRHHGGPNPLRSLWPRRARGSLLRASRDRGPREWRRGTLLRISPVALAR